MKKIILLLILWISFLGFSNTSFAACSYDWKIEECMKWTKLIQVDNAKIEDWFKTKINWWTNNIALFLGILAVWSVVYGGLMMTLSAWEDERIKKAKDIVKWWLVGFLWVVMATTIVTLVINLMYWFAG
jgi:hypothetical protein